jgi:nitroreductase
MELQDAVASRRAVRKYQDRPVDRETLEGLIQAAVLAPSATNAQPWAFGVVEGVERLRELSGRAKALLLGRFAESPHRQRYREILSDPAFNIFYGAPALVVVYSRPLTPYAVGDASMAAYTLMLAAHDRGLATCWIGFAEPLLQTAEAKAEFGVPADLVVVAPLVVGYPSAAMPPTPRNAPEMLFWKTA